MLKVSHIVGTCDCHCGCRKEVAQDDIGDTSTTVGYDGEIDVVGFICKECDAKCFYRHADLTLVPDDFDPFGD